MATRIFAAYRSVYFVHFLFYLGWPVWGRPVKSYLLPPKAKSVEAIKSESTPKSVEAAKSEDLTKSK